MTETMIDTGFVTTSQKNTSALIGENLPDLSDPLPHGPVIDRKRRHAAQRCVTFQQVAEVGDFRPSLTRPTSVTESKELPIAVLVEADARDRLSFHDTLGDVYDIIRFWAKEWRALRMPLHVGRFESLHAGSPLGNSA